MSVTRTLVRSLVVPLVVVAAVGCSSSSDDASTTTTTEAAAPTTQAAPTGEVDCAKVEAAATGLQGLGAQAQQIGSSGAGLATVDAELQQVVTAAKEQVRVIDRQARLAGTASSALEAYTGHNRQLVALFEQLVQDNDPQAFEQGLAEINTPEFEQAQSQVSAALKAACPSLTPG